MPDVDSSAGPQVQDAAEAPAPIPEPIASPISPEPTGKKTAVIVVAGTKLPDADLKIVVEARTYAGGADDVPLTSETKKSHYPTGADVYLRYDPEVVFPKDAAEVLTMGENVFQHNFWGFTRQIGALNVGPAHPAFAAANLAYQRGCTHIEIVGLTDAEKERLQPFFDDLLTATVDPAQVAVSFA